MASEIYVIMQVGNIITTINNYYYFFSLNIKFQLSY